MQLACDEQTVGRRADGGCQGSTRVIIQERRVWGCYVIIRQESLREEWILSRHAACEGEAFRVRSQAWVLDIEHILSFPDFSGPERNELRTNARWIRP